MEVKVAQEEEQQQQSQGQGSEGRMSNAAKAAVAAAATGAATIAVRKALSRDSGGSNGSGSAEGNGVSSKTKTSVKQRTAGGSSLLASVASGGWDAARDAVLPVAEDVAEAAGTYLATNGPEVLRDQIVPRFIDAFNDAREGASSAK